MSQADQMTSTAELGVTREQLQNRIAELEAELKRKDEALERANAIIDWWELRLRRTRANHSVLFLTTIHSEVEEPLSLRNIAEQALRGEKETEG